MERQMRRFASILVVLLGLGGSADAQQAVDPKKWEVAGSAALFYARPGDNDTPYRDTWYFEGRYAAAIAHYWTENLKTEVEYATSGEGLIYRQEFRSVPGNPPNYPYSVESFHRLEQASVRMVWQFGRNRWVHPYVSGGLVGDRERRRLHIPQQYQYVSGRSGDPIVLVREIDSEPAWDYRIGVTAGAGAKLYVSPNTFFNVGAIGSYSKPAATLSFLAGFGIDF
jgi:opacity protein-like surface antigen